MLFEIAIKDTSNILLYCVRLYRRAVIGVNVEDEDRETTWMDDADSVSKLVKCK